MKFQRVKQSSHSFKLDGKTVNVRHGEIVDVPGPEVLGSQISQYKRVKAGTRTPKNPLELKVNQNLFVMKSNSVLLGNPDQTRNLFHEAPPRRHDELEQMLEDFSKDDVENPGRLPGVQRKLGEAWKAWHYICDCDPLKRKDLDQPEGDHLDKIAYLLAAEKLVELEIADIKERLKSAIGAPKKSPKQKIERQRWNGSYRKAVDPTDPKGQRRIIIECDGRPVIQKSGKPVFENDGSSVATYLKQCGVEQAKRRAKRREINA